MDANPAAEPSTWEELEEKHKADPRGSEMFIVRVIYDELLMEPGDVTTGGRGSIGDMAEPDIYGVSREGWDVIVEFSTMFRKKKLVMMTEYEERQLQIYEQEHSSAEQLAEALGDLSLEEQRHMLAIYRQVFLKLSEADQYAVKQHNKQRYDLRQPFVSEFAKECLLEAARRFPAEYLEKSAEWYLRASKTRHLQYRQFVGSDPCIPMAKFYFAKVPEKETDREVKPDGRYTP